MGVELRHRQRGFHKFAGTSQVAAGELSIINYELSEGDHIVGFPSGGPNNYGCLTKKGEQECKVRGISLNSEGSKQLNFPVLCQNVLDDVLKLLETGARQTIVVKPYQTIRNSRAYSIETVPKTKKYQLVFRKQVLDPETFMTFPYGYRAALNSRDMDNANLLMELYIVFTLIFSCCKSFSLFFLHKTCLTVKTACSCHCACMMYYFGIGDSNTTNMGSGTFRDQYVGHFP